MFINLNNHFRHINPPSLAKFPHRNHHLTLRLTFQRNLKLPHTSNIWRNICHLQAQQILLPPSKGRKTRGQPNLVKRSGGYADLTQSWMKLLSILGLIPTEDCWMKTTFLILHMLSLLLMVTGISPSPPMPNTSLYLSHLIKAFQMPNDCLWNLRDYLNSMQSMPLPLSTYSQMIDHLQL